VSLCATQSTPSLAYQAKAQAAGGGSERSCVRAYSRWALKCRPVEQSRPCEVAFGL
jgi:hypothetical protein